jgi:hypothetical protein
VRTDRRAIMAGGFSLLLARRAFAQSNRCDVGRQLASLGKAMKSYSGDLGSTLITGAVPFCSGSEVISDFGILASRQDYEKAISTYGSASGSYGGGGGNISASINKSYSSSSNSVSIAFTKRVVRSYYEIPVDSYTKDGTARCSDARDFLQIYGDHIVYRVGVGGLCCYIFNYEFSSEKEASDFKLSINVNYGTAKGSYSTAQKTSFSNQKAKIKLYGFTHGVITSPKLVGVGDDAGIFSADFSKNNLQSLLNYFNLFENEFDSSFQENDRYSEVWLWTKPITQFPSACSRIQQDAIISTAARAKVIINDLAAQREDVEEKISKIDYMTSHLENFNTKSSIDAAPSVKNRLQSILQQIDNRRIAMDARFDLESKYDFRPITAGIPTTFCVRDPIRRPQAYSVPLDGKFRIYRFPVEAGNTTCTVEAKGRFTRSRSDPGYGRFAVVLMELLRGDAATDRTIHDNLSSWAAVRALQIGDILRFENTLFRVLEAAGARLTRDNSNIPFKFLPRTFSPADTSRYCVGAICDSEVKTRSIELAAYVSR